MPVDEPLVDTLPAHRARHKGGLPFVTASFSGDYEPLHPLARAFLNGPFVPCGALQIEGGSCGSNVRT